MFSAIGRFSYHFRWIVIGIWIALFAVSVVATPFLQNALTGGFSNPKAPSQQAAALIQEKFQQGPTQVLVVFTSDSLKATGQEFMAAEDKALQGVTNAKISGLLNIQTYENTGGAQLISKDGLGSVAVLNFSTTSQQVQGEVDDIRASLTSPTLKTYLSGEPAIFAEISDQSFRDLRKVERNAEGGIQGVVLGDGECVPCDLLVLAVGMEPNTAPVADTTIRLAQGVITDASLRMLNEHSWPGNVRELQNVVERAVIMCGENGMLEPEHLGLAISQPNPTSANVLNDSAAGPGAANSSGEFLTLSELEKHHIFAALDRCKGNRTHAAKILDVSIRTLRNKLHEYNGTASRPEDKVETDD